MAHTLDDAKYSRRNRARETKQDTRDERQVVRDGRQEVRDTDQNVRDATQHTRDIEQMKQRAEYEYFTQNYVKDQKELHDINQEILVQLKAIVPLVNKHEMELHGTDPDNPGLLKRVTENKEDIQAQLDQTKQELQGTKWQAAMGVITTLTLVIMAGIGLLQGWFPAHTPKP